eukprot:gene19464-10125_t
MKGCAGVEEFRKLILNRTRGRPTLRRTGVAFVSRTAFGAMMSSPLDLGTNQMYVRFCFSSISVEQIREGISGMAKFMASGDAKL